MRLSVFALICLLLTACAAQEKGREKISFNGIYRNVRLVKTGQVQVDKRETKITTPVINTDKSTVEIEMVLKNAASDATVEVSTLIQNGKGEVIQQTSSPAKIAAGGKKIITHTIEMFYPELWSIQNPYLYTAIIEVKVNHKLTDRYQTTFGIRKFE